MGIDRELRWRRRLCGCCNLKKPIVGVACIPGVPMSIAWCAECLQSGAIPYGMAVANTACCGGLEHCNDEWKEIVNATLKHFNKSLEQFNSDVQKDIKAMEDFDNA